MKDNKIFIHDLIDGVPTTSGKGVKYVETLSYVRFNKFLPGTISRYINDLADSENPYTAVKGISNEGGRFDETATQIVGVSGDVFAGRAFTDMNLAGSAIKSESRYTDRVLSLGSAYLGTSIFIAKENVTNLDPNTNGDLTFMVRMMLDSSRTTGEPAVTQNKAVFTIGDPVSGVAAFNITVPSAQTIRANLVGDSGTMVVSLTNVELGVWHTVMFTIQNATSPNRSMTARYYKVGDPATRVCLGCPPGVPNAGISYGSGNPGTLKSLDNPTLYVGYGELAGGVNTAFSIADFVSGVHLAEFAVFRGKLEEETMGLIAQSHLKVNQFSSGINSRPVKKVQQFFDSMTSYPSNRRNTGERLTNKNVAAFDSTKEPTFGKWVSGSSQPDNPRMMLYPEMIPADLYSGSGGFWYNGSYSPYFKYDGVRPGIRGNPQQVAGEPISTSPTFGYRDFTRTPYENRLVTTGAIVPGAMSLETELLNTVTHENVGSNYYTALGGRIKPFDDNQGGDALVINKRVSDWPEFDQKLGDVVAIEIPIPTTADCKMGVDETQGRIASMAYYNFTNARWDRIGFMPGISGSNMDAGKSNPHVSFTGESPVQSWKAGGDPAMTLIDSDGKFAGMTNWAEDVRSFLVNSCSIGFSGTSGFSILEDEFEIALGELPLRGRPTSTYGFPHTDQYVATDDQGINISDYIDAPFLLQRIAVEIDGEVEESGPSSLATMIRSRGKWKAMAGPGITTAECPGDGVPEWKMLTCGTPGVEQFFAAGGADGSSTASQVRLGKGLFHNYPSFVGGSSRPATADLTTAATDNFATIGYAITNQANSGNTPSKNTNVYYGKQEPSDSDGLSIPARIFIPQIAFRDTPQQRRPTAPDRETPDNGGPLQNSIKLLFGGISGHVTGSYGGGHAYDIAGWKATWVTGIDLYNSAGVALTDDSRVGGVPFWRCDTFFLLRQSPGRERFVGGDAEIYSTNIANNFSDLPMSGGYVMIDASTSMPGAGMADEAWGYSANPSISPVFQRNPNPPRVVALEETVSEFRESTRTTKRELITYAQLTHYGYAAAEQMLTASIFPSRYYYDAAPGPSSWTSAGGVLQAGNPAMLSSSAVYTQAMKWSSMGYGTTNRSYSPTPGIAETSTGGPLYRKEDEVADIHAGSGNGLLWKFVEFAQITTERTKRMVNATAISASHYGGEQANFAPFARDCEELTEKWTAVSWDWRYQCGTNFNNGGDCLWANGGSESSYTVAGADSAGNANINTFAYAVNSAKRSSASTTYPKYAMIDHATQRWHFTAIQRAGFSVVTSPCLPTVEGNDDHFERFGSFTRGGLLATEGGVGGWGNCGSTVAQNINNWSRPISSSNAPVKFSNWLEEGLGRDENVYVSADFTHKRTDIYGGKAGFTILTCSLPHVPSDLTGRFNGDHCIRGTFFEKRLLNAASFRIEAPVRQSPVIISDSSHLFCHTTAPGYLLHEASANYIAQNVAAHSSLDNGSGWHFYTTPPDGIRFSLYRKWWRCIPRTKAWIGDVGSANSTAGVGAPSSLTSGRRFFASMVSDKPLYTGSLPSDLPGPAAFLNPYASGLYPKPDAAANGTGKGKGFGFRDREMGGPSGLLSSSVGSAAERKSMYLLQPGDKLTFGFQPSLHGSNRGNNTIPSNPNVNPYGPWRDGVWQRNEILTGAANYNYDAETVLSRTDSRGQPGGVLRNRSNVNLESLYEPRQSFTIKSSQSAKLILYGTYVQNNRYAPSSTSQELRTNAVHEMISGGPIVDQFQTDNASAYSGSYIAELVTGSIFHNTNDYASMVSRRFTSGIAGQAGSPGVWANPGLRTSGSFQRFVRIPDTSEVFFDSLPPNPAQMFDLDLALSGGLNISSYGRVGFSIIGAQSNASSTYGSNIRGNARWLPSFPFEARYKSIKRSTQWPKPGFGTTGSASDLFMMSSSYGMGRGKSPFTAVETPASDRQSLSPAQYNFAGTGTHERVDPRWVLGMQVAEPANGDPTIWSRYGKRGHGGTSTIWSSDGTAIVMAGLFGFWKTPTGRFPTLVSNCPDGWEAIVGTVAPASFAICSHPSGWKYGLMNFRRTATSSVYRYDRYGQFRDQLEQRKYGRFYEYGDGINTVGLQEAAVTCIFVDSEGDPVTDPVTTSCNNLSHEMTSSVPYKEGETSRPPILTIEPITISSLI